LSCRDEGFLIRRLGAAPSQRGDITPGGNVISGNRFEVLKGNTIVDWKTVEIGKSVPLIELKVLLKERNKTAAVHAVIDSGTTGNLITQKIVKKYNMKTMTIPQPINLVIADNSKSTVKHRVKLGMTIRDGKTIHNEELSLYVGDTGSNNILLGMLWLAQHNPSINWEHGEVKMNPCPQMCRQGRPTIIRSQPVAPTQTHA
jgi:hypothetical protein